MTKLKNILGLTILEGLVSTAIVGIGFIAILQMVNYSVPVSYTHLRAHENPEHSVFPLMV